MPKQPTKKSQDKRKVLCRKCYTPMKEHLTLDGGWDWICERCGLRWKRDVDEAIESKAISCSAMDE